MRVISGGQTGADQAGLITARWLGFETGGTAPKGYMTETGPAPWLATYGVVCCDSDDYRVRTEINVQDADLTLIFGDPNTAGSIFTVDMCERHDKPYHCHLYSPSTCGRHIDSLIETLCFNKPAVINVAGNRESKTPGINWFASAVLGPALYYYRAISRFDPSASREQAEG